MLTDRINGTVKFFVVEKGYGFITPESGGTDVFVHLSDVPPGRTLTEQQHVSFIIASSDRKKGDGKKATMIQIVD